MKNLAIIATCFIHALLYPTAGMAEPTVLSAKAETCTAQQEAYVPIAQRYEVGLFFKLEKCGHPDNYIMGTLHSDSPTLQPIYEDALTLIKKTSHVGFEFVEDANTALVAAQYMFTPVTQSKGLSDMLSTEQFALLSKELKERLDIPQIGTNRMRPWAAAITLQYPPPVADGVTLDKRLQNAAQSMGKILFSIESPAEQFEIFASIPEDKQLQMLIDTLGEVDGIDEANALFMQNYVDRDLKAMHKFADASFDMMTGLELRRYMEEKLIFERNRIMANRLQSYLNEGSSLTAIGALHLMGETGILSEIEKSGWRVTTIH
ncbi:MAG: TraB/GumN family protein [Alphaproteobacteria bacterium]|nr:TraB/GumN family protein [Alphaproteobacteria bacterium]